MRLLLLGPLELRGHDAEPVTVSTRKRREVLAMLGLSLNHVVPVGRLLTAVWGEDPPRQARSALQGHVAQLRKVLGSDMTLATRESGYVLTANPRSIDVYEFRQLVEQARDAAPARAVDLLRRALDLYRGEPLAGMESAELRDAAAMFEQDRLAALEQLTERLAELGRGPETLPQLQQAALAHPFRESLTAALMIALYQDGRQAEALAVYQRIRLRLADELGVDPSSALSRAYESILHGSIGTERPTEDRPEPPAEPPATAGTPPVPAQLPRAPRGFAGRVPELRALDGLRDGALAVVIGPAGAGKTALTLHWAHRAAVDFPGGQLFADLSGFDDAAPADPETVLAGFLRALGVAPGDIPADLPRRASLYRSLLVGRKVLVILDNAKDAAQVRPLLPAHPGCVVVITSRRRLDSLVVTEGAVPLPIGPMSTDESVQMLGATVGRQRVAAEPEAAHRLADLCDGLPLALRVTAARLALRPTASLTTVADRLVDDRGRLAALATEDQAISVATTLELSRRSLTPEAGRLLCLLGLHPGGSVEAHAAAALAQQTLPEVREHLLALESLHLAFEESTDRYGLHDLVRLYCRHLADTELTATVAASARGRLVGYHERMLTRAANLFLAQPDNDVITTDPPVPELADETAALAWFEAAEPTIRALIGQVAQHDPGALHRLLEPAGVVYPHAGYLAKWCAACTLAVADTGTAADPTAQAEALTHYGRALAESGQDEQAHAVLGQAARLVGDLDDAHPALARSSPVRVRTVSAAPAAAEVAPATATAHNS